MNVDFFYSSFVGRVFLKVLMSSGFRNAAAVFLKSPASKGMIAPYIRRNHINMRDFQGQKFKSFADFFARKRNWVICSSKEPHLISPCDGRLSYFLIEEDSWFCVKDSWYRTCDLVTETELAKRFEGGCCLIYRLEAADYHHFCYIDDCYHGKGHKIPGMLHSVQPIACASEPVFRRNRRVWSLMETKNFGTVAQIEVGAVLVGGIVHEKEERRAKRGEEMGHFELAGSTIILLFTKEIKEKLEFYSRVRKAFEQNEELRVRQGQVIGEICK